MQRGLVMGSKFLSPSSPSPLSLQSPKTNLNLHRLKTLFNTLSILNILWIIYTMITVELTLNYNHIDGVLGSNGRIFFPSQLLPFTIGLCSFIRVTYLRFELFRSPEDTEPSLSVEEENIERKRASTSPRGKHWLQAFSPSSPTSYHSNEGYGRHNGYKEYGRESPEFHHRPNGGNETVFDNNALDPEMQQAGKMWRYLCAWLPWLHATSHWFGREKHEVKHDNAATSGVDWEGKGVDCEGKGGDRQGKGVDVEGKGNKKRSTTGLPFERDPNLPAMNSKNFTIC